MNPKISIKIFKIFKHLFLRGLKKMVKKIPNPYATINAINYP
jgi:hypothetical protein